MEQAEGASAGAPCCLPSCAKTDGRTRGDVGTGSLLASALPALGLALMCKTLLILMLFRDFSCLVAAWVLPSAITVVRQGGAQGGPFSCERWGSAGQTAQTCQEGTEDLERHPEWEQR